MIGSFEDFNHNIVSLQHSSTAEKDCFWLRIGDKEGKEYTTTQLTVKDAEVLIALLRKAIEEVEQQR